MHTNRSPIADSRRESQSGRRRRPLPAAFGMEPVPTARAKATPKKSPGSRRGFRNPGGESENQNVTLQLLM